jgi:hypothetical protein
MFDLSGLTHALDGHDAVVNLASAMPSTLQFIRLGACQETQRVRTEGSATVVAAALASDVGIVVQESVSMLYADRGDDWIDESSAVDHYPTASGNHAAEASAHPFPAAGAPDHPPPRVLLRTRSPARSTTPTLAGWPTS